MFAFVGLNENIDFKQIRDTADKINKKQSSYAVLPRPPYANVKFFQLNAHFVWPPWPRRERERERQNGQATINMQHDSH